MRRLADATLAAAAHRWPADVSDVMAREWQAELQAIRADPTLGPLTRAWRTIAFAGSIALSPAVEEAGGVTALTGAGGGVLALAACEMVRRSAGTVDAALPRVLDNSAVFGFGFLAQAPGRIALALLIGLLIAGWGTGRISKT